MKGRLLNVQDPVNMICDFLHLGSLNRPPLKKNSIHCEQSA